MKALAFVLVLTPLLGISQWDVPSRMQLNGMTAADRQVNGLAVPTAPEDGASAATVRHQATIHGIGSGVDQIDLALTPAPTAYAPGMRVSLEPAAVNTGPVTLNVNGLGAVPVLKFAILELDSADLLSGIPVELVYDGSAFQMISQLHPACPEGYMVIGRDVCAESVSHDPLSFYAASNYCVTHGARLCSFGEWFQGCAKPNGFLSSVLAFEWVDEAANNTNYAKRVGSDITLQIGCELGDLAQPLGLTRFRCCYDR